MARSTSIPLAVCCLLVCSAVVSARTLPSKAELIHIGRSLSQAKTYSYGEFDGYKDWEGECQQGDQVSQSPIDVPLSKIKDAKSTPTGALNFSYTNFTGATAVNTGHGVQVNVGEGNTLKVGGEDWKLLQYHFHSPSENALAGRYSTMEVHLVHSNAAGKLAVVGVLLNAEQTLGAKSWSSALAQGLDNVPAGVKEVSDPFTLQVDTFTSLLTPTGALPEGALTGAGSAPAVSFTGSLTTPPCTAGVYWYVLMKSSPIGANQALTFQRLLSNGTTLSQNCRPVQPILDREIKTEIA